MVWISESLIEDRFDTNPFRAEYIQDELHDTELYKIKSIENILRSVKDLTGGATPLGANYLVEGVRFIRTQDVDYNWIETENSVFINEEDNKKLKRSVLEINDVLLTITGVNFGKSAPVRKECLPANISQHSVRMHFKDNLDAYYVSTFLNCIYGQKQILKRSVGVTRPAIDYSDIKSIEIPIPSPEIQKYIGDKVRKAEELREEAKRLKKEAEEIIYKELNISVLENKFKDLNNKYTWVDPTNLENRVDSKYYDEKVLKIKNYFNKHYYTLKLKDCLQYCARGKSFAQNCEEGIILIKTKNLNNSIISYEENFVCEKEVNNNLILKEKDLLFASMGVGSLGKIDMYYPIKEKSTIDGTLILLRFRNDCKLKPEYVMEFIRTQIGQKLVYQNVVGSTGIISISVEDLINIDIPFIEIEKQEKISKNVGKYLANFYTSKQLIQEAKQDVEDLIEGNFDMSKVKANN